MNVEKETKKHSQDRAEAVTRTEPFFLTLRGGVLLLCGIVCILIILGVTYYQGEMDRIREEKSEELAAIGKLKTDQILRWRKERLSNIALFSSAPLFIKAVEEWLHKPDDPVLRRYLLSRLKLQTQTGIYKRAFLVDADGHGLVAFPETAKHDASDEFRDIAKKAWNGSGPVIGEPHFDGFGGVEIDIAMAARSVSGQPLVVTVLTNDADEFLFPMIQAWPLPSRTAETLLVRRDGDDALFLNELRHRKNTALKLRIPLNEAAVPAVQAILGKTGQVIGPDYRGREVFSYLSPVPGTSWYLVSKVDSSEILREGSFRAVAIFTIVFMMITGVMGLFFYMQRVEMRKERERERAVLLASAKNWRDTFDAMTDVVWLLGPDHRILQSNKAVQSMFHLKPQEVVGRLCHEIIHGMNEPHPECPISRLRKSGRRESMELFWGGRWFLVTVDPMFGPDGSLTGIIHVVSDITERKRTEEAAKSEEILTKAIIDSIPGAFYVLDERGGYARWNAYQRDEIAGKPEDKMAGFNAIDTIHPDDRALIQAKITSVLRNGVEDAVEGRVLLRGGPAFRWLLMTGRKMVINGHPFLVGSGVDITESKKAEEALQFRNVMLSTQQEASIDGILVVDEGAKILSYNHRFVEMWGVPPELVEKKEDGPVLRFVEDKVADSQAFLQHVQYLYEHRRETSRDEIVLKDGRTFDRYSAPMFGPNDRYYGRVWYFRDITDRKKTEIALRESETKLLAAQRMAQLGYWAWDVKTGNVEWSEEVFKIFRLDPEKFTPQIDSIMALSPWPGDRERDKELIRRAMETREAGNYEQRFLRPDQSIGWYASTFQGRYGERGDLVSIVGTVMDITERKKAEEAIQHERDFSNAVLGSLPGVLYCYDERLHFRSWNKNFEQVTGYTPAEIARMSPLDLFTGADKSLLAARIQEVFDKGVSDVEADFLSKDGTRTPYYFTGMVAMIDNQRHLVGVGIDITDRKKAEEEIKSLNRELEERVKRRTAELATALKELEAFSYSVAHDLKAPLRAMAGFANILSEDYASKLDENGRRVIGVIGNNAKNMGRMIDDLLNLSHTGRVAMNGVDIDVTKLVRSVCHELKNGFFKGRVMDLDLKPLPSVRADPMLVRQIFMNLIFNAMKFTARKEKAVVEIGGYDKDGECVYYVKDNGVGFDMKYKDKLFETFQRLHTKEKFEGTGIGLAIVKSAVQRHGGRVWAEAEAGQGATFYFTLPQGGASYEKR